MEDMTTGTTAHGYCGDAVGAYRFESNDPGARPIMEGRRIIHLRVSAKGFKRSSPSTILRPARRNAVFHIVLIPAK